MPLLLELFASGPVLAQDNPEGELTPINDPGRSFDCGGFLYGDPATVGCIADENGFYTTESGFRFPVGKTNAETHANFLQYGGVPGQEGPTTAASSVPDSSVK